MLDKIYASEIADGLQDKLSQASIAYCAEIKISTEKLELTDDLRSLAENTTKVTVDDNTLFHIDTILCTTNRNLNTDVFTPEEVWTARHTPVDKPLNLEHNEVEIIGHITESKPVDINYNTISDNTDINNLPDKFHIQNSAVIYTSWQDADYKEKIDNIVAEISRGEWFVSMECLFKGFDYSMTSPDGESKIISRSEDTAYLTKHLRQYGGTGSYEGYSLGRVLRNITFSGKGLVRRPANPESIIFSVIAEKKENNLSNSNESVYLTSNVQDKTISMEIPDMDLEAKVIELEGKLSAAQLENHKTKASELQSELDRVKAELEAIKNALAAKDDEIENLKKDKTKAEEAVAELGVANSDYESKVKQLMKDKTKADRTAKAVEAGVPKEGLDEFMSASEDMSDDHFLAFVKLVAAQFGNIDVKSPNLTPTTGTPTKETADSYVTKMINKYSKGTAPQQNTKQVNASEALDTAVANEDTSDAVEVETDSSVAGEYDEAAYAEVTDYLFDNKYLGKNK